VDKSTIRWAASNDTKALYIIAQDSAASNQTSSVSSISTVHVRVESQRLFPTKHFEFNVLGEKLPDDVYVMKEHEVWYVVMRIPLESIRYDSEGSHPIRIDVKVQKSNGEICSWRPNNPTTERLILGTDDYADLGWLVFRNNQ